MRTNPHSLVSAVHVIVDFLAAGARGGTVLGTVASGSNAHAVGAEIDNLDGLGGTTTVLDTGETDVGAVHVPLGENVCGPGPDKEALVLLCAGGDVAGDLDWPLVVRWRREWSWRRR